MSLDNLLGEPIQTLSDPLHAIARDELKLPGTAAVIAYGSHLYQDLSAPLSNVAWRDFRDKVIDYIVVFDDAHAFFDALGEKFEWNSIARRINQRWAASRPTFYIAKTQRAYPAEFSDEEGVTRLQYKLGVVSVYEFERQTCLGSDDIYIPMRVRGITVPQIANGYHGSIMQGIIDSRKKFIRLAFEMAEGRTTGLGLIRNYVLASYLTERYRGEGYKADDMLAIRTGNFFFRDSLLSTTHLTDLIKEYAGGHGIRIESDGREIGPGELTDSSLISTLFYVPHAERDIKAYFDGRNRAHREQTLHNFAFSVFFPRYGRESTEPFAIEGLSLLDPPSMAGVSYITRKARKKLNKILKR